MKNLENLIGLIGKTIKDFNIIWNFPLSINDETYNLCVIFVDGLYQAVTFNYEGILIKEVMYVRNKYNLLKLLYDEFEIQDIKDILDNKINYDKELDN